MAAPRSPHRPREEPPKRRPEFLPKKGPEKPKLPEHRDRYEEVRADANASFAELNAQIVTLTAKFKKGVIEGKADPRDALMLYRTHQESMRRFGARKAFFARLEIQDLPRQAREARRKGKSPRSFSQDSTQRIQSALETEKALVLVNLTGSSPSLAEPEKLEAKLAELNQLIPDNYLNLPLEERLAKAKQVKEKFQVAKSPEQVMELIIYFKMTGVPLETFLEAFQNEQFAAAFAEKAATTPDVQKAFEESLDHAPPELKIRYERYQAAVQSDAIADFFRSPPEIPGSKVEFPSQQLTMGAVYTIEAQGLTLHISKNNFGEIHYGSLVRNVALYAVDGQPRLFIYDENADKGVVGPVDPKEVRTALGNIVIDTFFSEKFREFSTSGTEQDPTKVVDAALFKIAHALLPEMQPQQTELDARQQIILSNLARLLVAPDGKYISMADKIEFLKRVAADPSRQTAARKLLAENDFSAPGNAKTMSDFEIAAKG